jgi:hypothetical protein
MTNKVSDLWGTPPALYQKWHEEFNFNGFDPAPFPRPEGFDGTQVDWPEGNIFVNAAFSLLAEYCRKARLEQLRGRTVVMLMPCRSHRVYFHDWVLPYAEIRFLRPISFVGLHSSNKDNKDFAPFPCILAIYHAATPEEAAEATRLQVLKNEADAAALQKKRARKYKSHTPSPVLSPSEEAVPRPKKRVKRAPKESEPATPIEDEISV